MTDTLYLFLNYGETEVTDERLEELHIHIAAPFG